MNVYICTSCNNGVQRLSGPEWCNGPEWYNHTVECGLDRRNWFSAGGDTAPVHKQFAKAVRAHVVRLNSNSVAAKVCE